MEDFVTYDIAKKLKEKGFEWNKIATYNPRTNVRTNHLEPTISQVLKWLREQKDIFVNIDCSCNDSFDFFFTIYKKGEETWEACGFNDDWYKSPEQSSIAGIAYVLDNLI